MPGVILNTTFVFLQIYAKKPMYVFSFLSETRREIMLTISENPEYLRTLLMICEVGSKNILPKMLQ